MASVAEVKAAIDAAMQQVTDGQLAVRAASEKLGEAQLSLTAATEGTTHESVAAALGALAQAGLELDECLVATEAAIEHARTYIVTL